MTRPPCVRLCPAYPGNPRTRIEGESPPFRKRTYGLRSAHLRASRRVSGEISASWFETALTRLLTMRVLPIPQPRRRAAAESRDPVDREHHGKGDDQHRDAQYRDRGEVAAFVEIVDQDR